jgi:hypothetical protein
MTSSIAQARADFDAYVSAEPERLAGFRRAIALAGGPQEGDLDLSRESLGPLGAWFVARPDDPVLREGLASYLAATLRARHPMLAWRLDETRTSTDYGRPVLAGFGQGQLFPIRPVSGKLAQARTANPADRDWLIKLFDIWSAFVPAQRSPTVTDGDSELDEAEIWISEATESIIGEPAFGQLEARLNGLNGVERIAWEDREHFLVRLRRGWDLGRLRDDVRAALHAAKGGP